MVQMTSGLDHRHAATVRALSSLTPRDAAAVRATARATGNLYNVQEHDDYDGYLSLLLAPQDETASGFLVSGRTGAIDLAELQGDEMVPLGQFPSIGAAMLALRPALETGGHGRPAAMARRMIERHGSDADLHAAMRADAADGHRWRAVFRAIDRLDDNP